jgi:hypothetical protein
MQNMLVNKSLDGNLVEQIKERQNKSIEIRFWMDSLFSRKQKH